MQRMTIEGTPRVRTTRARRQQNTRRKLNRLRANADVLRAEREANR